MVFHSSRINQTVRNNDVFEKRVSVKRWLMALFFSWIQLQVKNQIPDRESVF